jgi:NADH dehydrogenase FAD-containing subunit
VRGRVAIIGERSVELETGAVLPFDYLILAPGSTYADNAIKDVGGTAAERQALIEVGLSLKMRLRTRCPRQVLAG